MKNHRLSITIFLAVLLLSGCNQNESETASDAVEVSSSSSDNADPLPSWNEGSAKSSIISFVQQVSDPQSAEFVKPEDRIATFDNDGTLWAEQPAYFQLFFVIDRIKAMESDHPEWKNEQPFKAVLENDMHTLGEQGMGGLMKLLMATHSGMTTDEFDSLVGEWMTSAKHPVTGMGYTDMTYQPMLELINYLQANDFDVFIVSGGGIDFMRTWAEQIYGIPKNQIIGSTIKTEFDSNNGQPRILRKAEIEHIDDKEGKPVTIQKFIGRKPIFAAGNSDGDLQMLQWTDSNQLPSLQVYVHHTDSVREYAYDRNSSIGRLDKGLDEARDKGWVLIDMKDDWNQIYRKPEEN
jgi:phosphoserine phosphatase